MNTPRFNHKDCTHDVTPASRKRCRARRVEDIRKAQAAFNTAWNVNETHEIREYEAIVFLFATRWNLTVDDAFDLVENGPVV